MCVSCGELIKRKESRSSHNFNNPNCIISPVGLFRPSNIQCAPFHDTVGSAASSYLVLFIIIRLVLCPFLTAWRFTSRR